ncbi:MAG: LysM peptidoglycan-binding domain-containing protein [Syntrophales bacterium]|nr:LysM peptidoglycan-binding domain-containing protein [Syntrophales bacterium]
MRRNHCSGILLNTFIIVGYIFTLSGCGERQIKTATVEAPPAVEQDVAAEKPTIVEQVPAPEKQIKQIMAAEEPAVKEQITTTLEQPSLKKQAKETTPEEATLTHKVPVKKKKPVLSKYHLVKKGESLWWIAKYKDRYNDPFLWPIIYRANKNKIKNPDVIYPGQKFRIPRGGYTVEDIKKVRKNAGAPWPYVPPAKAVVPVD